MGLDADLAIERQHPLGSQIAALPLRLDRNGRLSVLMVTSRGTGRWVVPKGWTMEGHSPWGAAGIEALEEAGAEGRVASRSIGSYEYDKRLDDGTVLRCRVEVFPMLVCKLRRNWKERDERIRRWFTPKAAAQRVDEPELAALLRGLSQKPEKLPVIRDLLGSD
ncbi:NUDIX hydrolase [Rhodovulum sulfidophilum]|uniref:NUDIX hydrolase n=1 Tax=Rhodovulum sulfidophilum TaxID=35806 RepID=UPI001922C17B|nr:NUDIX hydrolase [Rhodovulum sulfidophilum]MBL3573710.1 NUDIX hydrolase [Rhodovulum sulfidophilum]MCF4117835.1 NUDIX hydrolase [Rhodovulum sulfidophilum]